MNLYESLNDKQKQAVTTSSRFVRIIAGAGSGKTRVLTTRIAYLVEEIGVPENRIIGFTFTNKAAGEMTARIKKLLNKENVFTKLSTFHSFGARFLREEIRFLNRSAGFTIYDDEDTRSLIRNICVERGHEKRGEISKETINFIGSVKEKGYDAFEYKERNFGLSYEKEMVQIWRVYENRLMANNAVDFPDLVNLTIKILNENKDVRKKWQDKYDHILVDEFQDTNDIQFNFLKLLMGNNTSFYVVGDPDQTIYTWRGANEEIIIRMDHNFPNTETIIMEQNYRSTQQILDTANTLIKHNKTRLEKDLFTSHIGGEPVSVQFFASDVDEVQWIYRQIEVQKLNNPDFSYRKVAILLRANYLTLPFEKFFIRKGINYEIYGGIKFYQRKEIKDALAYFRLLLNEKDDVSFERVVNLPRRGVGDVALNKLKIASKINEYSLLETIRYVPDLDITPNTLFNLKKITTIIDNINAIIKEGRVGLDTIMREYLRQVGYLEHLDSEKDEDKKESTNENISYLIGDIAEFIKNYPESTFSDYLENASLHSAQDEVQEGDYITLMTVHMAKGLEYDYVFVSNLNEGVFPNNRAVTESGQKGMEEERRLCYVAFTRAKVRLYVTSNLGFNFAMGSPGTPSRFISEAGLKPVGYKKHTPFIGTPKRQETHQNPHAVEFGKKDDTFDYAADFPFAVNDIIEHTTFGSGIVTAIFPTQTVVEVKFDSGEVKKLLATHKALSKKGR